MLAMIGNILIGLFFVFMGIYNLKERSHLQETLRGRHCQMPEWLLILVVALEIVAGAMLIFNFAAKVGAIYLIAFTVVVSYLLHPFWSQKGRDMWKQLIIVSYNVAIIGGLFLILAMQR